MGARGVRGRGGVTAGHGDSEGRTTPRGAGHPSLSRPPSSLPGLTRCSAAWAGRGLGQAGAALIAAEGVAQAARAGRPAP